ncbi:MAG TPA: patatin-like protein [Ornithinibacter sp.]|nr:patatin-like protein [Ornithinibacter sp.]
MDEQGVAHGLREQDLSGVPPEEIRVGVVMNGGVSLAVWMGGVALELDRLVKAHDAGTGPYATLLAITGCSARVDVVSGTSAGGVNGAALALAQANRFADLASLRDVWVEQGRIEALLRQPFRGSPSSLLKGDDHFLPQLNAALTRLAVPTAPTSPQDAPIDLTVMTTVLRGNQEVSVDSLGQRLPQSVHGARFHWRRPVDATEENDPFGARRIRETAAQLALAARSSSSFPVAFEPAFVPVSSRADHLMSGVTAQTSDLRPDMSDLVEDWGDVFPARDRSRYVVDGGVLANTPTRVAVEAIERMPADGPVRRVMLLVYPHAPAPGPDPADSLAEPPTLTGSLTGVMGALSAQGSRTFVDELEDHNIRAAGRRGTRADILSGLDVVADQGDGSDGTRGLEGLGVALFPHYRRMRLWHAARDLARRRLRQRPPESFPEDGDTWDYERIRRAAERAQHDFAAGTGGRAGTPIPYGPEHLPTAAHPDDDDLWHWGVTGAVAVAEAANELLRGLVWVLPKGADWDVARKVRRMLTERARLIHLSRALTDDPWEQHETLTSLRPDTRYWTLRLASYARLMTEGADEAVLEAIEQVAHSEHERRFMVGRDKAAADAWEARVRDDLRQVLLAAGPGSAGRQVRQHVERVVEVLQVVLPVLQRHCDAHPVDASGHGATPTLGDVRALHRWRDALAPGQGAVSQLSLLTTLLQLEVASATIGDETSGGSTIPIEVVQLSAQTDNAFARYSRTGDDKLGGWSVKRFGGFLKRSWRVNDWTWGRLDAATVLCRSVLHPGRVRRAAYLSGYLTADSDPRELARATVDDLVEHLLGGTGLTEDPRVRALREDARAELTGAFTLAVPTEQLSPMMPALAHLFAWSIQLDAVTAEVPALAASVREDRADGANPRSRGELFLAAEAPLLSRVESAAHDGTGVSGRDRAALLTAFDRAGVGREPLGDETSSDLMIRSASTAGAVGATVLDSPRSGLGALRPATRLLRGLMLVGHWMVLGLTSKAVIARGLTLVGLAVGAVLVSLSLFGVLPEAWSGPAAMFGISTVLVALAYGTVRSRTLLHGVVLLTPVVPLLAYALFPTAQGDASAQQGAVTLLAVVGLALGLMLLGSLPASTGSVWAALDRLADRLRIPKVPASGLSARQRGLRNAVRRARGLAVGGGALVVKLLLVLVPAGIAWTLVRNDPEVVTRWLRSHPVVAVVVAVVCTVVGAWAAAHFGSLLRVLRRAPADSEPDWEYAVLTDPVGAEAGWAVLYGAGYFVIAGVTAARTVPGTGAPLWQHALVVSAALLGLVLTLVLPLVAPHRALRAVEEREAVRDRDVARFTVEGSDGVDPLATARRAYAHDLVNRGVAFRWLVSDAAGQDGLTPSLSKRGRRLLSALDTEREARARGAARAGRAGGGRAGDGPPEA